MSILDRVSNADAVNFLTRASEHAPVDIGLAAAVIEALLREQKGTPVADAEVAPIRALEKRWYGSVESGAPDFSVYSDPYYFCDVWLCWITYSRKYLREIQAPKSLFAHSIAADMAGVQRVLDLGCGFGYTTAALKEIFHGAMVKGTNLANTAQFAMATKLGFDLGFSVQEQPERADLIFASEYFEHFQEPVEHLLSILKTVRPRYALIANTFTSPAIGHFPRYWNRGSWHAGLEMSRMFNATMRANGYVKVKTRCWNNRPAYWKLAA